MPPNLMVLLPYVKIVANGQATTSTLVPCCRSKHFMHHPFIDDKVEEGDEDDRDNVEACSHSSTS